MDLVRECKRTNPRQKMILLSGTVDELIYKDAATKPDGFLRQTIPDSGSDHIRQKLAGSLPSDEAFTR